MHDIATWGKIMDRKKRVSIIGIAIVIMVVVTSFIIYKEEQPNNKEAVVFGATYMTMNNSYFEILNDNIQEIIEANGDVLISRDPFQDQKKQNEQIYDMLDEGIEALFLNSVDWKGVTPALERCKKEGVPVFVVDTGVYREDLVVSTIMSDNYNAGVQCAKDVIRHRKNAKIIILNHAGVVSTEQRTKGFMDTIQSQPEMEVVVQRETPPELEGAMHVMKDILNEGKEFDVVFGANDPIALGAIAAMKSRKVFDDVLVYGIDGSVDAKQMIKEGVMRATSAQSPIEIGRTAAKTAYDFLEGKEIDKSLSIPVKLITKDTLDNYSISDWQ